MLNIKYLIFLLISILVLSCLSSPQNQPQSESDSELLTDVFVKGKSFSGNKDGIDIIISFQENGSFIIVKGKDSYEGTWKYDGTRDMLPFTIEWEENGEKQGYIASIVREESKYIIIGHWFITDAYITLMYELNLVE